MRRSYLDLDLKMVPVLTVQSQVISRVVQSALSLKPSVCGHLEFTDIQASAFSLFHLCGSWRELGASATCHGGGNRPLLPIMRASLGGSWWE